MRRVGVVLFAGVVALVVVPFASASFLVARDASDVSLRVQGGRAIVDYRAGGIERHVVLSGAINARAPDAMVPQVEFRTDFGVGRMHGGTCLPYDGPALPWLLVACRAPDGSYWALQQWQRQLPDYGVEPNAQQASSELHLSHWTGALPVLKVSTDWSYHRWQHLFGTYTYDGTAVFGFGSTSTGQPLDSFGRNVYLDSMNSNYLDGRGTWMRVNSWLTHKSTGAWCYGVSPHGSADRTGAGSRYRLTIMGPGVTPDVSVTVGSPGRYNATADAAQNTKIAALHDTLCKPN